LTNFRERRLGEVHIRGDQGALGCVGKGGGPIAPGFGAHHLGFFARLPRCPLPKGADILSIAAREGSAHLPGGHSSLTRRTGSYVRRPFMRGNSVERFKANFHEKAHFVKVDVATLRSWSSATALRPSRYASIRTLDEPTLFGGSVHREIQLSGLLRRRCNLRIGLCPS
jgi:hypothetical protein